MAGVHEDFGEKIGGAKKDLWKDRGLYADDLEAMNEREAEKFVKKDNVWKKPDYAAMLEDAAFGTGAQAGRRIYSGRLCQLVACEDHELELSEMFASCLVKRLPAGKMAPVLRGAQGRLQTAGLVCAPEKRAALAQALARCGVVRITRAGSMSHTLCGEAHDGEYPLRRYVRLVETDE